MEAKKRQEQARVWMSGLEAVHKKVGIRGVYDLSATPFFLSGSGYPEGTLFPWVVSDFSLIDAIESGIVKVPRVPVEDNSMTGEQPTYRDLCNSASGSGNENVGAEYRVLNYIRNVDDPIKADNVNVPYAKCTTFPADGITKDFPVVEVCE